MAAAGTVDAIVPVFLPSDPVKLPQSSRGVSRGDKREHSYTLISAVEVALGSAEPGSLVWTYQMPGGKAEEGFSQAEAPLAPLAGFLPGTRGFRIPLSRTTAPFHKPVH